MVPALLPNQLVVAKSFDPTDINRGSVIFFRLRQKLLVKRIIGLPEEMVILDDGLSINDHKIEETYLNQPREEKIPYKWECGEDEVILLGDNPINSLDSRKLGPIPLEKVELIAWFKLWPPGRIK